MTTISATINPRDFITSNEHSSMYFGWCRRQLEAQGIRFTTPAPPALWTLTNEDLIESLGVPWEIETNLDGSFTVNQGILQ